MIKFSNKFNYWEILRAIFYKNHHKAEANYLVYLIDPDPITKSTLMKRKWLLCLLVAIIVLINNATAKTYTWVGLLGGSWTTASNWSPGTAYPGQSGTTDTAYINISTITITLNSSITISRMASTTFGVTGITIQFLGSPTLKINNGISIAQPLLLSFGITFSGPGTAIIGGYSNFAYLAGVQVASGTTVSFIAGSTVDFTTDQSSLVNNGALNFTSSTFLLGFNSFLVNHGTVNAVNTTFTLSGSPVTITNNSIFNATSCAFSMTGTNIHITNTSPGVFTTKTCTFTGNTANTGTLISNSATFIDHGSTFSLQGQQAAITNSGTGATFHASGSNINFNGPNTGLNLTNSATFTADSATLITLGTGGGLLTNTGTFYAGTSNSTCTITLSGQGSNIANSAVFKVGSTSILNPGGVSANITNTSPGIFTLQSDNFGSATISSLSSTATISGTFNVERYITTDGTVKYRGYRLLSSPVNAGSGVYTINYLLTSIYVLGTTTNGGFDNTVAANPTLYLYRENLIPAYTTYLNSNFRGINNIKTPPTYSMDDSAYPTAKIFVGDGYLCFFRGNRASASLAVETQPTYIPQPTTLTATGSINQGQIIVQNWFTPGSTNLSYTSTSPITVQGFNLMGNPYASSIDWETSHTGLPNNTGIYTPNVGPYIWVLDPISHNFGAYMRGSIMGGTNNATNIIASGQGFFVAAVSSGAQLYFNETAKTNTQVIKPSLLLGKPADNASVQYLRLKMAEDLVNTDEIIIRFESNAALNYEPGLDAPYLQGLGQVSLSSISNDHVNLAINVLPLPALSPLIIGLNVNASNNGNYTLNLNKVVGVPELFDIWLMDAYKKDSINMRHDTSYSFSINKTDSTSFGSKRFSLVIRQNPALGLKLLGFTCIKLQTVRQVQITWETVNEENYTHFTIERSTDGGKTFDVIGSIQSNGQGTYSLLDKNPVMGQNLYRLKQEDINNSISYSKIVIIGYANLSSDLVKNGIDVYPNPARNTIGLTVAPDINASDIYDILITNSYGFVIKKVTSSQLASWQTNVNDLTPGSYIIRVVNNKDKSVVGWAKFVKL